MNIRLSIERFWNYPSDIERWLELLRRLPDTIPLRSRNEIAKTYLGFQLDDKGRLLKTEEFYGMFGLEKRGNSVIISGCNFIQAIDGGYEKSYAAKNMIQTYETNGRWEILLAEQVLKFSPRVRAIVAALLNGGELFCPQGFLKKLGEIFLRYGDLSYYIFSSHGNQNVFQ